MKPLATGMVGALPGMWTWQHRRSRAVRIWRESALPVTGTDPLFVRSAGGGNTAFVLLHGLISTGQVFGQAYDQLGHHGQVVVPDLAGFGGSLQENRTAFTIDDHLDALDGAADQHGLFGKRWVIGAHSMGSTLAAHWALRHPKQVDKIVCWGAPVYQSATQARSSISGNVMARLFALDTELAERACALSCRHRGTVGLLTAALEPRLPMTITRAAPLHTWPAYRDAMRHLVVEPNWQRLLSQIADNGTPTRLVWGDADSVGDKILAHQLTAAHPRTTVTLQDGANHHLPITHPDHCLEHLTS